jgi:hypothetical protein
MHEAGRHSQTGDPMLARMLADMQWDIRSTSGAVSQLRDEVGKLKDQLRRWVILGGIWGANIMGYLSKDQASDLVASLLTSLIK